MLLMLFRQIYQETMELSPQRKSSSKRRRDILDASLRCFMRHGFGAATIEQIREASGASSGSIYHHFGSKQAIAVALYVEGMEELAVVFRNAMTSRAGLQEGIHGILTSYFRWVAEHRDWALYLLRVATADVSVEDAASIDEVNRRTREDLEHWLRPFAERAEIIPLPSELYASLLFGAATHLARHWLVGRLTLDLDAAAEHLSVATWRALTNGSTSPPVWTEASGAQQLAPPTSRSRATRARKESVK